MAIEDLKESLGIDDDDFKGIKDGVNALDKSTSKFRKGVMKDWIELDARGVLANKRKTK